MDRDRVVEQALDSWLGEERPPLPNREARISVVLRRLDEVPQRRPDWLGRWSLGRKAVTSSADDHGGPSDDTNTSTNGLVVAAFGVAAGIAVLALGATLVIPQGWSDPGVIPAAGTGETIVVAQDGSGAFSTISAAVETTQDGDTVLVKPGTYTGLVTIRNDITLTGEGPREEIILTVEEGPILRMLGSDAILSGFSMTGDVAPQGQTPGIKSASDDPPRGVDVVGGAPTLDGLEFIRVGGLSITDGSSAVIVENTFIDGGSIWVERGASPRIEGNELSGGPEINLWGAGDGTLVRGNSISGTLDSGIAVFLPGTVVIEQNTIVDAGLNGISVGWGTSEGVDPVIRGNTISGSKGNGIGVASGAQPTIEGNTLADNRNAIFISRSDARISGNDIHDNTQGILIRGGSPTLEDNTVTGGIIGLTLDGPRAGAILSGNMICANETDVMTTGGAEMPDTGGNADCGDTLSEASR